MGLEDVKKALENKNKVTFDEPQVEIYKMKVEALKDLADEEKTIFSQIAKGEDFEISRALLFSKNALPTSTERLKTKGIDYTFDVPVIRDFVAEIFVHRLKIDRKRVEEYLEGLKSIGTRNELAQPQQQGLLGRLRNNL